MTSSYTPPPEFKKNQHHYVPQFWMRRFRDANNQLWQWDGQTVEKASPSKIMQLEWLYTVYDDWWRPSDTLENQLAKLEGDFARVFTDVVGAQGLDLQKLLPDLPPVLALQACRHPDVLLASHRRAGELADVIADAPLYGSEPAFVQAAQKLGVKQCDAQDMYRILAGMNPDELAAQAEEVRSLSPQDPKLPMTDALRAWSEITPMLAKLAFEVLDSTAGSTFVLGDTPLSQGRLGDSAQVQAQLGAGFVVPVTKDVALRAFPASAPSISRRKATTAEVQDSNTAQWRMAGKLVVGCDPNVLNALGPK